MSIFRRKIESLPEPEPTLTPGYCECAHLRCCHIAGTGACQVFKPIREGWPTGSVCACQIYIFDPDENDDDDDDPEDEPTPSPEELERLYQ